MAVSLKNVKHLDILHIPNIKIVASVNDKNGNGTIYSWIIMQVYPSAPTAKAPEHYETHLFPKR